LWASSSLAEVGLNSVESSVPAANQLLESLKIDVNQSLEVTVFGLLDAFTAF